MSRPDRTLAATNSSPGLHRFAVLTATVTFVLIFVGGLVTSTGSALAVPDWPLAFGHLIPRLVGGVRFEYGHRVVAAVVVILTLVLAVWMGVAERRAWVRKLAYAAVGLVVLQAILGGITVLLLLPLPIAVAHAGTAQAFFCLMVALALFTNAEFGLRRPIRANYARPRLAVLATITTVVIYLQILVGAVVRHLGAGLAIPDFPLAFGHLVPPYWGLGIALNFAHRCGALVVTVMVVWTCLRVARFHREIPPLRHAAELLIVLLAVQITLGALTILSHRAVMPTTAHVAVGAGVLATALALTLRAYALGGLAAFDKLARLREPLQGLTEPRVSA